MKLKDLAAWQKRRNANLQVDHADNSLYGGGFKTTLRVTSDRPSRTKIWTEGMYVARGKVTSSARPTSIQKYHPTPTPEPAYTTNPETTTRFDALVQSAVRAKLRGKALEAFARRFKLDSDQTYSFVEHVTRCLEPTPTVETVITPVTGRPSEPAKLETVSYQFAEPPTPRYHVNPADVPYWEDTPLLTVEQVRKV